MPDSKTGRRGQLWLGLLLAGLAVCGGGAPGLMLVSGRWSVYHFDLLSTLQSRGAQLSLTDPVVVVGAGLIALWVFMPGREWWTAKLGLLILFGVMATDSVDLALGAVLICLSLATSIASFLLAAASTNNQALGPGEATLTDPHETPEKDGGR
jgi:hypothetical protein